MKYRLFVASKNPWWNHMSEIRPSLMDNQNAIPTPINKITFMKQFFNNDSASAVFTNVGLMTFDTANFRINPNQLNISEQAFSKISYIALGIPGLKFDDVNNKLDFYYVEQIIGITKTNEFDVYLIRDTWMCYIDQIKLHPGNMSKIINGHFNRFTINTITHKLYPDITDTVLTPNLGTDSYIWNCKEPSLQAIEKKVVSKIEPLYWSIFTKKIIDEAKDTNYALGTTYKYSESENPPYELKIMPGLFPDYFKLIFSDSSSSQNILQFNTIWVQIISAWEQNETLSMYSKDAEGVIRTTAGDLRYDYTNTYYFAIFKLNDSDVSYNARWNIEDAHSLPTTWYGQNVIKPDSFNILNKFNKWNLNVGIIRLNPQELKQTRIDAPFNKKQDTSSFNFSEVSGLSSLYSKGSLYRYAFNSPFLVHIYQLRWPFITHNMKNISYEIHDINAPVSKINFEQKWDIFTNQKDTQSLITHCFINTDFFGWGTDEKTALNHNSSTICPGLTIGSSLKINNNNEIIQRMYHNSLLPFYLIYKTTNIPEDVKIISKGMVHDIDLEPRLLLNPFTSIDYIILNNTKTKFIDELYYGITSPLFKNPLWDITDKNNSWNKNVDVKANFNFPVDDTNPNFVSGFMYQGLKVYDKWTNIQLTKVRPFSCWPQIKAVSGKILYEQGQMSSDNFNRNTFVQINCKTNISSAGRFNILQENNQYYFNIIQIFLPTFYKLSLISTHGNEYEKRYNQKLRINYWNDISTFSQSDPYKNYMTNHKSAFNTSLGTIKGNIGYERASTATSAIGAVLSGITGIVGGASTGNVATGIMGGMTAMVNGATRTINSAQRLYDSKRKLKQLHSKIEDFTRSPGEITEQTSNDSTFNLNLSPSEFKLIGSVKNTIKSDLQDKMYTFTGEVALLQKVIGNVQVNSLPKQTKKIVSNFFHLHGWTINTSVNLTEEIFYSRYLWNFWKIINFRDTIEKTNLNRYIIEYFDKIFSEGVRMIHGMDYNYGLENWERNIPFNDEQ